MVGLVMDGTHYCMVQIRVGQHHIGIDYWRYAPISYPMDKFFITFPAQYRCASYYLASSLPYDAVEVLAVDSSVEEALAATSYSLGSLYTATPESPSIRYMLICHREAITQKAQLAAKINKKLIAIDWQPAAYWRGVWLIAHFVQPLFGSFRSAFLATIAQFKAIHFEVLGVAFNGLLYVEN